MFLVAHVHFLFKAPQKCKMQQGLSDRQTLYLILTLRHLALNVPAPESVTFSLSSPSHMTTRAAHNDGGLLN